MNHRSSAYTLLLDFDGVMVRDPHLTAYQLRRSAKFVQKHTYLPLSTCLAINSKHYPKYGHTVLMLNDMFGKQTTLEQYNEFVFSKAQISRLDRCLSQESFAHTANFKKVFEQCKANNIEWNVFTNAHLNWALHFSHLTGLQEVVEEKVIYPKELSMLKPNPEVYASLSERFADKTIIFVDDSRINLEPVTLEDGWVPIHFSKTDTASDITRLLDVVKMCDMQ